jgi:hypothetical protein
MKSRLRSSLVIALLVVGVSWQANAAPTTRPSSDGTAFMRFVQDADGHARLEMADVAYRNAAGVTVHLIGAVHVADPEFYDGLNESFRHYDALLYEMVKPKDSPAPGREPAEEPRRAQRAVGQGGRARGASGHWIGMMQRIMKDRLKLTYQLDGIDYRAPNFVHADLDWETFNQLQEERGESFATLFFRSAAYSMGKAASGKAPPGGDMTGMAILGALMSPDSARELKLILAQQFMDSEDALGAMEGKNGSVLLTERNKAAFRVLKQQVDAGKKYLGIFYGAGHLKPMEQMLTDMGYRKVDAAWRTAWDIPPAPAAPTTNPTTNSTTINPR